MSPLRLGIQTRQTLTKLRVSAGAEEKHSTLAPLVVSALCAKETTSQGSRPGGSIGSSITMTLNGVDLLVHFLRSYFFPPPKRECVDTHHIDTVGQREQTTLQS